MKTFLHSDWLRAVQFYFLKTVQKRVNSVQKEVTNRKSRVHGAIGFGFDWLKNWRESFKPITKRSNRNHVITFDSHLKTAL